MPIWRRKRTVSIDEYCRDFYDNEVFYLQSERTKPHPVIGWGDEARRSLTNACPQILQVDSQLLQRQLTAARLELFAIAWLDEFERGQSVMPHTAYTAKYLQRIGRGDVWESMGEYNKVVATAGTTVNGVVDSKLVDRLERLKSDMRSQWVPRGYDEDGVIRVANRLLTRIEPHNGTLDLLGKHFLGCTGCSQHQTTALSTVSELMSGLYTKSRVALSGITLRESLNFRWF